MEAQGRQPWGDAGHPGGAAKRNRGTRGSSDGKRRRGQMGRRSGGGCWVFRAPAIQRGSGETHPFSPGLSGGQGLPREKLQPWDPEAGAALFRQTGREYRSHRGGSDSVEDRLRPQGCARRVSFHPHWLSTLRAAGLTPGPGAHPRLVPKSVAWPWDATQRSSKGVRRTKRKNPRNPQEQHRKVL